MVQSTFTKIMNPFDFQRFFAFFKCVLPALTRAALIPLWFGIHVAHAQSPEVQEIEISGDWRVLCRNQSDGWLCFMNQTLSSQAESGTPGGRLLEVNIGPFGESADNYLIAMLPFGLNIQTGAAIQIDEGTQHALVLETCLAQGCRATLPLDSALARSMAAGNVMKVGFVVSGTQKTAVIPVSLRGFTKAYGTLNVLN